MKLCELFSCCLPVQKKKHRNERVDTSNKKKRKEAKHFKKEMADRRRKETLEMDISKVQSVETVVVSLDEVKNGPAERLEGEYAVIAIHHAEMANARPVSRPRAEKENISEPNQETSKEDCTLNESSVDQGTPQLGKGAGSSPSPLHVDGDGHREFSKEDCILIESSVDHGTPQLDEGGGRSPSPLHVDGDGHREFSKEDCNTKKSSVDYGTPQLDEGDGKNPTPLHGGGDGAGPVPRLKLDWHKYQLTVGKPTAQAGAWRTADTPEEKDVMEEERVKILHGFFERRGITTQNTTTQTTLTTEEEKPTPQSAVWHTKIPEERNEEKRKILHGFVKRRGLTACRPRREFNTQLNG
ncbi:hypothetical protein AALO_G00028920 [Alosa alosa]|uniref:Uncharacterized protein n=1 Tax=Alosa alosa TaxID=278164 RepID=A0AAV6HBG9_9TELE|nr:uncharacterized protein LOC125291140 isoform X1 [Alosa alosa]KAG5284643.1 hypothetical protein AALO_G00028920 [Alosa alosa]